MIKIVKFKDGKYGIRKGVFNFSFKELSGDYWWTRNSGFFSECKGNLKEVEKAWNNLFDYGEVVYNIKKITK